MAEEDTFSLQDIVIYPYPNKALTEILLSHDLEEVVGEYTLKVASVFTSLISARPRKGDKHPGLMAADMYAYTDVGGFKHDRVVGEVGSAVDYMAADEYGRHASHPYEGHHDLTHALYSVLPYAP